MIIDAEQLIESINSRYPYITDFVLECLQEIPTEEIKTGKWEFVNEGSSGFLGFYKNIPKYYCTNCSTKFDVRTKYCPECGARMDNIGVKPLGKEEWYS